MDPDANGDGIPDCQRNDSVKYHVIRSFGGSIKKVIKVRQLTREEDALLRLKEAVDHRLHRIRALMEPDLTVPEKMPSEAAPVPSKPRTSSNVAIPKSPKVTTGLKAAAEGKGKGKPVPPAAPVIKAPAKFVKAPKVPQAQMGKRKLQGILTPGFQEVDNTEHHYPHHDNDDELEADEDDLSQASLKHREEVEKEEDQEQDEEHNAHEDEDEDSKVHDNHNSHVVVMHRRPSHHQEVH
ncbi:unnamed protein product [Dibothriocephalus latus]|uniref:Uncharacterized protein n=1 Tax=Dibothriocephalus latus TaxID=60516 RepID=A0A3P7NBV4_DIBLA|nr:unnamed protein product [Dibothriocephalus latus]